MQRLKKILKRLALALGILLALALIANAILIWHSGNRLDERMSKLRAAGEPLSLPELGSMPAAPGADAAVVLKRVESEVKALSKEMAPVLDRPNGMRDLSDGDWKTLEKAIANHPLVLSGLFEAAVCPAYHSPLNYQVASTPAFLEELLPFVQIQREVANILACQARLQVRGKDYDGAMRTCLAALRIARHAEYEPMIISYLVCVAIRSIGMGVANEILRAGPVSAELHRELETELAKDDNSNAYRRSLRSERAFGLQALDELSYGGWFTRAYINDEKCFYIDLFAEWIMLCDSSYAQFQDYDKSLKAETGGIRHRLSRLLIPAVVKVREADFRVRCIMRCLRVLNAITARKIADAPAKLADLGLPAEAIIDPYTDKPLVVKQSDGQWVIYGLGADQKDDGGQIEHFEDIGLGPVKKK